MTSSHLKAGFSLALSKLIQPVEVKVANMVVQGCAGSIDDSCLHPQKLDALDFNIGILVSGRELEPHPNVSAGVVTLTNVSVSDTVQPGFEVENKLPTDMAVKLKQCSFTDVALAPSLRWGGPNTPMLLHQSAVGDVGGFTFQECAVADTVKRPFLSCDSCEFRGAATDISGSFAVSNPHGCT